MPDAGNGAQRLVGCRVTWRWGLPLPCKLIAQHSGVRVRLCDVVADGYRTVRVTEKEREREERKEREI